MAHRVEIIPASAGRSLPDQLANGVVIPGLRPIRSWYLAGCEGLRDAPKGRDALVLDFLNYGQGDLEMLRSIFGKLGSRAGSAGSAGGGRILVDDSEVGLQSAEAVQNPSADSSEEMTLLETL